MFNGIVGVATGIDRTNPRAFVKGLCGSYHVPIRADYCPAKGQPLHKYSGVFLLADRTPHVSKGQYSGLRGSKRTRFTNKPAQQALFERLCTNTADRKRTISHRIGAVEEESNGYARGSVSQSLVATWPKSLGVSLLGLFYGFI